MRKYKSSSNDRSNDLNIYLQGVPEKDRVKLNGKIIRKGKILNGGHREVMLIADGEVIHHQFQD